MVVVREEIMGMGLCFYWGPGSAPRILWAHSTLVNLKHESRNLKPGKIKTSGPSGQSLKSTRSLNKSSSVRAMWAGSLSSPVAGNSV